MAIQFDTARATITYNTRKIFNEGELDRNASVKNFDGSKDPIHR